MNHRVRVDFVPSRNWPAGGILLVAAATAVVAWQVMLVMQDSDQLQRQRAGLETLRRKATIAVVAMSPQDIRRHVQIEVIARHLATPWEGLLGAVESPAGLQVHLIKLEPDATSGRIELTGRAGSVKDLAEYMVALEGDSRVGDVLIHRHEILRNEAGSPVEFRLGASWNAEGRRQNQATLASAQLPTTPELKR